MFSNWWILCVLLITTQLLRADAGRLDPQFVPPLTPNGPVHDILELPDGSVVIGGEFTQVGTVQQAYLAKFDANGVLDSSFSPVLDGAVFVLEASFNISTNGFYVGGSFTTVNQVSSKGVVRLKMDGELNSTPWTVGSGFNGPVYAIKPMPLYSRLLVGGDFTEFKGVSAGNLVSLNTNDDPLFIGGLVKDYQANGSVHVITEWTDSYTFICAGSFSGIDNRSAQRIALINSSGYASIQAAWPVANNTIKDAKVLTYSGSSMPNNSIVVTMSGDFTSVNGQALPGIASFFLYNTSWQTISFGDTGITSVSCLQVDADNRLLAASDSGQIGAFTEVQYLGNNTWEWQAESDFLPSQHANSSIHSLHQSLDGRYYIGGNFTELDGINTPYFTRLYGPQGSAVPASPSIAELKPTDILAYASIPSSTNYITGYELQLSSDQGLTWHSGLVSEQANNFLHGLRPELDYWARARIENYNGWSPYGDHISFSTPAMRDAGTLAYVPTPLPWAGGLKSLFTDSNGNLGLVGTNIYNDTFAGGLAVVDDQLQLQYLFNNHNPNVDIAAPIPTGGCYVEHSSGVIQRLSAEGVLDSGFTAEYKFPLYVRGLVAQSDRKVIVGGDFTISDGASNDALVRLDAAGNVDASYAPVILDGTKPGSIELLLPLPNDGLLVMGEFDSVNGIPAGQVVKLTSTGAVDTSFFLDPDTSHFWNFDDAAVDSQGRVILAGVLQDDPDGDGRFGVQRLAADGSIDTTWQGAVMTASNNNNIGASFVSIQTDGKIIAAGSFTHVNGQSACSVVRLNIDGSIDSSFDAGLGTLGESSGRYAMIRDIACLPNGNIAVVGWFKVFDGVPRDNFALLRGNGSLSPFQQWLLIQDLPLESSPSLDNDGDGVGLAHEFAYHMNPHQIDEIPAIEQKGVTAYLKPPLERLSNIEGEFSADLKIWQVIPVHNDWSLHQPSGTSSNEGFYRAKMSPTSNP